MTKEEAKKHIIKCAKKTFSKSVKDIKKDLQENCKKNGFGVGLYARLKFCGYVNDIKF